MSLFMPQFSVGAAFFYSLIYNSKGTGTFIFGFASVLNKLFDFFFIHWIPSGHPQWTKVAFKCEEASQGCD